jgi:hypothetical protein
MLRGSAQKISALLGMLEVALFADILTLKEALEFDAAFKTNRIFAYELLLPVWIADDPERIYSSTLRMFTVRFRDGGLRADH